MQSLLRRHEAWDIISRKNRFSRNASEVPSAYFQLVVLLQSIDKQTYGKCEIQITDVFENAQRSEMLFLGAYGIDAAAPPFDGAYFALGKKTDDRDALADILVMSGKVPLKSRLWCFIIGNYGKDPSPRERMLVEGSWKNSKR